MAAVKLSVSTDTIDRRAVEWQAEPVKNRILYKLLKLDEGTRQERRYQAFKSGYIIPVPLQGWLSMDAAFYVAWILRQCFHMASMRRVSIFWQPGRPGCYMWAVRRVPASLLHTYLTV